MTSRHDAARPIRLLHDGLNELGLDGQEGVEPLERYVAELERWNEKLGLVHASGKELIVRHILDSLAALPVLNALLDSVADPVVADIGSGGGLPGIPLACFLPGCEVLLVERSAKKCGFLRGALIVSGISNARVIEADAATVREAASVVVLRAFHALTADTVATLMRCARPGGALCAYKGRRDRIDAELRRERGVCRDAAGGTGDSMAVDIIPVRVPFLPEERHLVVMRERRAGEAASTDHPSPPGR